MDDSPVDIVVPPEEPAEALSETHSAEEIKVGRQLSNRVRAWWCP
jgi:hypothetical protein